jgi:hypothetical protein
MRKIIILLFCVLFLSCSLDNKYEFHDTLPFVLNKENGDVYVFDDDSIVKIKKRS